jgi:hypothetical protein
VIRKGSMMSVTAKCFALTPRVSLNACRPAKTLIHWLNCFLQAERSSCGTAQLPFECTKDRDTIAGLRCHLTSGPEGLSKCSGCSIGEMDRGTG